MNRRKINFNGLGPSHNLNIAVISWGTEMFLKQTGSSPLGVNSYCDHLLSSLNPLQYSMEWNDSLTLWILSEEKTEVKACSQLSR